MSWEEVDRQAAIDAGLQFYPDELGGGCLGECVPNFEGFLATCIYCHQPIN